MSKSTRGNDLERFQRKNLFEFEDFNYTFVNIYTDIEEFIFMNLVNACFSMYLDGFY